MCSITKANELFMKGLKSTAKYEEAMAQAKEEADTKCKELEALIEEDELYITIEEVEIGLASIDTYRGYEVDAQEDEKQWINENIKVSDILDYNYNQKLDTIDELSKALNMSTRKVTLLLVDGLGIKLGSDYQNIQRRYVEGLEKDINYGEYRDLADFMDKKSKGLYDFYRILLMYVKDRISKDALGNDEDELVFYVKYDDLRTVLKNNNYQGGLSRKALTGRLRTLCDLKLLTNLEDEDITDKALYVANKVRDNISKTMSAEHKKHIKAKRRNHYTLNDLTSKLQQAILTQSVLDKKYHYRQKDKTDESLTMMRGENHGVVAQRKGKISESTQRKFKKVAQELLDKQNYFTEEQLRRAYCAKDHNLCKADSEKLTKKYLSYTVRSAGCMTIRVNYDVREYYSLPKKIKSNSFIFVKEDK